MAQLSGTLFISVSTKGGCCIQQSNHSLSSWSPSLRPSKPLSLSPPQASQTPGSVVPSLAVILSLGPCDSLLGHRRACLPAFQTLADTTGCH